MLFFGTYDERTHPRIEVLREGLAAHGATIEVCNRPIGLSTADRVDLVRRPWRVAGRAWALARVFAGLRRDARQHRDDVDVVVVGYLGVLDIRLARRWFDSTIVLDHMAPVAGTFHDRGLGGLRARVAERIDRRAVDAADIVLVDTDEHAAAAPGKALVVPVGASRRWFDARRSAADDDRASVVFFGLYTPLQGIRTIATAAARTANRVRWTLIGGGQERAEADAILADAAGAVKVVDWVDADALPDVVADHDICLGIFGTTPKADRVVPNKVFQGAAAGCAVVTSDTAPQRRALGSGATYVPAGDADALTEVIESLATDRARRAAGRAAAASVADERFSPAAVVAPLVEALRASG